MRVKKRIVNSRRKEPNNHATTNYLCSKFIVLSSYFLNVLAFLVALLAVLLVVYTFFNLLVLLESASLLRTSVRDIELFQQGYRYHKLRQIF